MTSFKISLMIELAQVQNVVLPFYRSHIINDITFTLARRSHSARTAAELALVWPVQYAQQRLKWSE